MLMSISDAYEIFHKIKVIYPIIYSCSDVANCTRKKYITTTVFILSFPANRWNGIHRFPLLLADNLCINLRDTDTGMSQQLADGVQLGSIG